MERKEKRQKKIPSALCVKEYYKNIFYFIVFHVDIEGLIRLPSVFFTLILHFVMPFFLTLA